MMRWKLLPHPSYSPDLVPSDFQPFGPLKESLGGLKFEDDQQHVLKFFHITDKISMPWASGDLWNAGNVLLICREIMLKNDKLFYCYLFKRISPGTY